MRLSLLALFIFGMLSISSLAEDLAKKPPPSSKIGDIEITFRYGSIHSPRVIGVGDDEERIVLYFKIANCSETRRAAFDNWNFLGTHSAKDEFDNEYAGVNYDQRDEISIVAWDFYSEDSPLVKAGGLPWAQLRPRTVVDPEETVGAVVILERPIKKAKKLRVTLPAKSFVGLKGAFEFDIDLPVQPVRGSLLKAPPVSDAPKK
jgi:hypothetical protein